MKTHRLDPISLLLGVTALVIGVLVTNGRLGNLVNDRPDALIPLLVLGAGLVAVVVATRRSLADRAANGVGLLQDVDGAGDDQHHSAQ